MDELTAEDSKLLTLARSSAARINQTVGAAVRDGLGRTYASAAVDLPSLRLTALQAAVAQAAAAGADKLEAAVLFGTDSDEAGVAAVADVTKTAPVYAVVKREITQIGTAV
ncbi:cytidine deaminase [Natronoglycomyces albus]|uniref:Cytidine deaminase n=1 Tax=Natronoglycomyces albus TaxID=2811108 RepID=A0A895XX23_9ACTN|nr:cytidine deaminase [Natronoglycomyces albus]